MDEDRLLVQQLLAGDTLALRRFFDEYFDRLYRFAYARLRGDAALAEDAVQNALARAFAVWPLFAARRASFPGSRRSAATRSRISSKNPRASPRTR